MPARGGGASRGRGDASYGGKVSPGDGPSHRGVPGHGPRQRQPNYPANDPANWLRDQQQGGAHVTQKNPMERGPKGSPRQSPVSHDNPSDPRNPNYSPYTDPNSPMFGQQNAMQPYGGGGGGGGYPQPDAGYDPMEFWSGGGDSPIDSHDIDAELVDGGADHDAAIEDDHDHVDAEVVAETELSGMGYATALEREVFQAHASRFQFFRDEESAYTHGRMGFIFSAYRQIAQGIAQSSVQVLSMEMDAMLAQEWTLVLNAIRYSSGPVVQTIGNNNDPDHFASSQINLPLLGVQIEWGVDGAYERCIIDYPSRGSSLSMCASTIRVSLLIPSQFNFVDGQVSQLGGFLTPRGKRQGSPFDAPTRTIPFSAVAAGAASAFVKIPDRARAYRIMNTSDPQAVATPTLVKQVDGVDGNTTFSDDTERQFNAATLPVQQATQSKIHPAAQFIRITTAAAAAQLDGYVQFDLDLG